MTEEIIPYRFLVRGGTAANLAAVNEIPKRRELVFETDTGLSKLGDGATPYNGLPYVTGVLELVAGTGVTVDATDPLRPIVSAAAASAGGQIGFGVSNGADPVTGGVKRIIRIIEATEIEGWFLSADGAGNAAVELWASTTYPPEPGDLITASAPPSLSATSSASGGVAGWTAVIPAGSWLAFRVADGATVSRIDLTLQTKAA